MARRVIVETLCDPCLAKGSEVAAEELPPLPLIGNKPRVLALCPDHRAEVYEPLLAMVKEHGQIVDIEPATGTTAKARVKTATPEAGSLDCPECRAAETPRSFTTPQGLGAHRYRVHGVEAASKQEKRAG